MANSPEVKCEASAKASFGLNKEEKVDRPCVFDEVSDMLDMSIFTYWVGDVRKKLKDEKLACEETENALFQLPSSHLELLGALKQNRDFLSSQKNDSSFDLYFNTFGKDEKKLSREGFHLLRVDDEHEGKFGGPVFVFTISHQTKRVTVAFRGSVTTKDFICDWKTSLAKIPNPIAGEPRSGGEFIQVHHGFKAYLYDPLVETNIGDGVREKQPLIVDMVTEVANLLENYPGYQLYTTGHSLGGALATLFAMEAGASNDPRIPKPVTCISIASPRVGNVSFAKVFNKLEESRRVRCIQLVNDDDMIPGIPATAGVNCIYLSCCQSQLYRHVGAMCTLRRGGKHPLITYPRHISHPFRLFFSDLGDQMMYFFSLSRWAPLACTCQTNFASNHGCKEYFERLQHAETHLKRMHLNRIYGKHNEDLRLIKLAEAVIRDVILG